MNAISNLGTTLVLGATGKTGRRVAARLRDRGLRVRAGSRTGSPPFDWDRPESWEPIVRGVESAYITYQPDLAFPGAAEAVRRFARLAVGSGVRRLVLLSGRGEEGARLGEQAVCESGAEWTIVRASFFAQNFSESSYFVEPLRAGVLPFAGGDVQEPFIDANDIADVAAAALMDAKHAGQLYEVTGQRLLTFGEAVAEISAAAGYHMEYVPMTLGEYRSVMVQEGVPAEFAKHLTDLFAEVLDGRNAGVADGVQKAIGRQPRDFKAFAREAAASGVWAVPSPLAQRV